MTILASPPQQIEASADFLTWFQTTVGRVENLLPIVAILAVGFAVLKVYHRSGGALAPTLVTLLVGGAVVWGIMNVTWFSTSIGGVFNNGGAPAPPSVVHLVPGRSA
jgi:hypothetical protein